MNPHRIATRITKPRMGAAVRMTVCDLLLVRSKMIASATSRCCLIGLYLALTQLTATAADDVSVASVTVEYHRDIAPLLQNKCQACHGGAVHESDLWLDSYERILKGGPGGQVVVPGKPEESPLFLLASRHDEPAMPPLPNDVQATALTNEEINLLKLWIQQGAVKGNKAETATDQWRAISAARQQIYTLAMSPDQRTLLAGRANQIVHYDLLSQRELTRLVDPSLNGTADHDFIQTLAFSSDGRLAASGGYRNVKIWERLPAKALSLVNLGHPPLQLQMDSAGQRVAFQLDNQEIVIWDVNSGPQRTLFRPHVVPITGLTFSPQGQSLITSDSTGVVRFWSPLTGEKTAEFKTAAGVTSLVAHDATDRLISAHTDGVIRVWKGSAPFGEGDPAQPTPLREIKRQSDLCEQLLIVENGAQLISAGSSGIIQKWDIQQGTSIWNRKGESPVTALAAHPDGSRIVIGYQSGLVEIRNAAGDALASLTESAALAREKQLHLDSAEISRQQLATANQKKVQAEASLAERQRQFEAAVQHFAQSQQAVESLKQETAAAEQEKLTAEVSLAEQPEQEDRKKAAVAAKLTFDKKSEQLSNLTASCSAAERGTSLAKDAVQAGQDNLSRRSANIEAVTTRLNSAEQQLEAAREKAQTQSAPCRSVSVLEGGNVVLATFQDQAPRMWEFASGHPLEQSDFTSENSPLMIAATEGTVVGVDDAGQATHWNLAPRWKLKQVLGPPAADQTDLNSSRIEHRVNVLAFNSACTHLATGGGEPSRTGEVLVWDLAAPESPVEFVDAHSDTVLDLQFSRDGTRLVTCGADKFCKLFDITHRTLIKSFEGHTDHVLGVSLSANEELLASGSADRLIKVWDVESGELRRSIENGTKQVTSVNFIGITGRLISASGDCHVMIHDAGTGQNERSFVGAQDYVYDAITSPDGRMVIAGGEDGVVRVWNGATGEQLMTFEPVLQVAGPADH